MAVTLGGSVDDLYKPYLLALPIMWGSQRWLSVVMQSCFYMA